MTDFQRYAEMISNRLTELGVRMHDIDVELKIPKPADLNEQAIDIEDDEVLEGLGRAAEKEILLLKQALNRIKSKTYGTCQKCDEPISDDRLRAVPYAVLCRSCASGD